MRVGFRQKNFLAALSTVVLLGIVASCGGGGGGTGTSSPRALGTAEPIAADLAGDAFYPQIAMAADGSASAVWYHDDGIRTSIWANRFDGTAWTTAQPISTDDAGNAFYPQIAMAADGSTLAVWCHDDGDRTGIRASRFDGTTWATAQPISTDDAGDALFPQIAMAADGKAIAVWDQHDGDRTGIWTNRFDGTAWATAEMIESGESGEAFYPQIAMAANGSAIAVWFHDDGTRTAIWASRFDGTAWAAAQPISSDDAGDAFYPQIAMADNGKAIAVWELQDGDRTSIWTSHFDGVAWATAQPVPTDDVGDAFYPQISMADNGSAIAVWELHDGARTSIWASHVDGSAWAAAEMIESGESGNALFPQIAMAADGNALAVWDQHDGTRTVIFVNRFDGAAWGAAEPLATDNTGNAYSPQVALDGAGKAVAVWEHRDGSRYSIWANRFE